MTRKGRGKRPTLDGVQIKIDRAQVHKNSLNEDLFRLFPGRTYVITPEIYDDGRRHVFRASNPPDPNPAWSATVGDCLHNLRSALDHLAYQLVLRPNTTTQFPIKVCPPREGWRHRRVLPDISGGVRDPAVRTVLEKVQPYNRRDLNHGLGLLRELNNIDKHRELIVTVTATTGHLTSAWTGDPNAPPPSHTTFTHRPLKHGEVIAVIAYESPYRQADPNLQFFPDIAFGDGGPVAKENVGIVLDDLMARVCEDIKEFESFFPTSP